MSATSGSYRGGNHKKPGHLMEIHGMEKAWYFYDESSDLTQEQIDNFWKAAEIAEGPMADQEWRPGDISADLAKLRERCRKRYKGLHHFAAQGDCWCEPKVEVLPNRGRLFYHRDEFDDGIPPMWFVELAN